MYTVVASVSLSHPASAVYAALASLEGTVRWQHGVRAVRRTRSKPRATDGPGAAPVPPLVLHYWALGTRHRLRATVTACAPPEHFAWRAEGDDGLVWDLAYTVDPTSHGCHVTSTLALHDWTGGPEGDGGSEALVRLRRLLARRLPRDLACLETWVAVQPGARRPAVVPPAVVSPADAHAVARDASAPSGPPGTPCAGTLAAGTAG